MSFFLDDLSAVLRHYLFPLIALSNLNFLYETGREFNRGGEAELDADPVVVVVLVLSDLGSRESNTHLGLRSNNRPRQ